MEELTAYCYRPHRGDLLLFRIPDDDYDPVETVQRISVELADWQAEHGVRVMFIDESAKVEVIRAEAMPDS